jgi:Tfp pilus assembly protein PilO
MNRNRVWVFGAVTALIGIAVLGWFVGISPQLAAVASTNQNRAIIMNQNRVSEVLLARLKRDYLGIDALKTRIASLQVAVPTSAQLSTFVTELNLLAARHKVTVKAIAISDAQPYTTPPAPPVSKNSAKTAVLTNPKITPANFVVIPIQISITGVFGEVLDFVHEVQVGPRLFLVATLSSKTSMTSTSGVASVKKTTKVGPTTVDSTIGGFVYVLLASH